MEFTITGKISERIGSDVKVEIYRRYKAINTKSNASYVVPTNVATFQNLVANHGKL